MGLFSNIKFFVLCHGMLQLAQLLVSGYLKGSISTIERRYGFSSQMSGLLASFNEVGNTVLIVFVSYFGSRVHRPRCIGIGAMIASLAAFLIALPHFISKKYEYRDNKNTSVNISSLCRAVSVLQAESSNQTCSETDSTADLAVFPILLLGQLLLGIGGVPIQPFGISYVDDYANKKDSPLYLGILFAVTVIGPAFGYLMSSSMLQIYVDFNTQGTGSLKYGDAQWVGAWWLGFLVAGTLLFLTSLPYLFFPREMEREENKQDLKSVTKTFIRKKELGSTMDEFSLVQFIKRFPQIMLRTLKNPIYLLVVLAQVNLAAMVAGVATFMPKFIERQFTKTAAFSNAMIGGFIVPSAMLGIMAGGLVFRRLWLSVKGSAAMCIAVVLMGGLFALPLLFLGCSTQRIAGVYPDKSQLDCSLECSCSNEAFNPVCGSNGIEYRSPCHAGCRPQSNNETENYTDCSCVTHEPNTLPGFAVPKMCDNGCAPLLIPFVILCSLSCLLVSFAQTPSFMMILRSVKPEDKSFALGIQYMLFRVLAFLPSPVLYGTAIDSTCILWGEKCKKETSCHYYDLDLFRHRFLGLQTFFVFGGLVFFLLSFLVLKRIDSAELHQTTLVSSVTIEKKAQEKILQKATTVPQTV